MHWKRPLLKSIYLICKNKKCNLPTYLHLRQFLRKVEKLNRFRFSAPFERNRYDHARRKSLVSFPKFWDKTWNLSLYEFSRESRRQAIITFWSRTHSGKPQINISWLFIRASILIHRCQCITYYYSYQRYLWIPKDCNLCRILVKFVSKFRVYDFMRSTKRNAASLATTRYV